MVTVSRADSVRTAADPTAPSLVPSCDAGFATAVAFPDDSGSLPPPFDSMVSRLADGECLATPGENPADGVTAS